MNHFDSQNLLFWSHEAQRKVHVVFLLGKNKYFVFNSILQETIRLHVSVFLFLFLFVRKQQLLCIFICRAFWITFLNSIFYLTRDHEPLIARWCNMAEDSLNRELRQTSCMVSWISFMYVRRKIFIIETVLWDQLRMLFPYMVELGGGKWLDHDLSSSGCWLCEIRSLPLLANPWSDYDCSEQSEIGQSIGDIEGGTLTDSWLTSGPHHRPELKSDVK